MQKKIFISHSNIDEKIGEKLVDALVNMGIPQDIIFFSSKYHTGVGLGSDFSQVVKTALEECEIVIFLLTKNFYQSEYCLNEMGAVWYSNKKFIPVLLGELTFNDMKGFLDSHYIALRPKHKETYKLFVELKKYIDVFNDLQSPETIFNEFIEEANKVVEITDQYSTQKEIFLSETEKTLLQKRFTDNEIILLNYFIETNSNYLKDTTEYNPETGKEEKSVEFEAFEKYCLKYINFDYRKAKRLLEQSDYLSYLYTENWDSDYIGCELDINIFRDIISLSEKGNRFIAEILAKHKKADILSAIGKEQTLEELLLNEKLSEIEILLFAFMIQKNQMTLGTRWMTAGTVANIQQWEEEKGLYGNILSRNYENALSALINREMVEVASCTSYGNPREYRLKQPLINQLYNLSPKGKLVLVTTITNNIRQKPNVDVLPF